MRFYFHLVRNEDVIPDSTGVEITDPEDLQRTALRIIHEVQAEVDPINTYWHGACHIRGLLTALPQLSSFE